MLLSGFPVKETFKTHRPVYRHLLIQHGFTWKRDKTSIGKSFVDSIVPSAVCNQNLSQDNIPISSVFNYPKHSTLLRKKTAWKHSLKRNCNTELHLYGHWLIFRARKKKTKTNISVPLIRQKHFLNWNLEPETKSSEIN